MIKQYKIRTTLCIIAFIIIGCLMFLVFNKINKIESLLMINGDSGIVNIDNKEENLKLNDIQSTITQVINSQNDSIATIYTQKKIKVAGDENNEESEILTTKNQEGNAILISQDGYLITNKHVVQEKQTIYTAKIRDKEYNIEKIWYDDGLDIAILKIKDNVSFIAGKIATKASKINIGDIVFAVKKDSEINEFDTKIGMINSLNQKLKEKDGNTYIGLIKSSTNIEGGYSGGPLINLNGEIIGINTAIDNIEYGASYSLPITQEFISNTISSIKKNNKIIRPNLGIEYMEAENGIKITKIDSIELEQAGLKLNDIIVGINDKPITKNNFLYELYTYELGKSIILNVNEGNMKKEIQVKLIP